MERVCPATVYTQVSVCCTLMTGVQTPTGRYFAEHIQNFLFLLIRPSIQSPRALSPDISSAVALSLEPKDIARPAKKHRPSRVSWVFCWPPPSGTCLPSEASRRHPKQMPEPLLLHIERSQYLNWLLSMWSSTFQFTERITLSLRIC